MDFKLNAIKGKHQATFYWNNERTNCWKIVFSKCSKNIVLDGTKQKFQVSFEMYVKSKSPDLPLKHNSDNWSQFWDMQNQNCRICP